MKVRTVWLLIGSWLVLSLGLKLLRYEHPPRSLEERSAAAVTALMARHGWDPGGPGDRLTTDGSVRTLVFRRAGCARPVTVVVLPDAADMGSLARHYVGTSGAFLVNGRFRATPPSGVWGLDLAGSLGRTTLPVLAIAPAPVEQPRGCDPPEAGAWRVLEPARE